MRWTLYRSRPDRMYARPRGAAKPFGNGVLVWFEIDDFDDAVARAVTLKAEIVLAPHRNPPSGAGGPNHREAWLRRTALARPGAA
jgi:hypothetical protein